MRKTAARLIAGMLVGTLFVLAVLLAYVADLLDRDSRQPRIGTPDGPPESLQQI